MGRRRRIGENMDIILVKKTLVGALEILTAGSFVYFALQVKFAYGDTVYYPMALICLTAGFYLAYSRG